MKKTIYFLLVGFSFLTISCHKEDPPPPPYIYVDFTHETIANAQLVVNRTKTASVVHLHEDPVAIPVGSTRIQFTYNAVTFKKGRSVYAVTEMIPEVKSSGRWIPDSENQFDILPSKNLNLVLVLDMSSSLGTNIPVIKSQAKQVINNILVANPDVEIAVIKFSRGNNYSNFSNNITYLSDFIDAIGTYVDPITGDTLQVEDQDETALYEAVNKGVDILNQYSGLYDGKGILTFTDGHSNFQFDPANRYDTPDVLIEHLSQSEISNYTIGYKGNQNEVEEGPLKAISVNGNYSFPKSVDELNRVFIKFSNNIATVYDFVYNTNNGTFPGVHNFRCRLKLKKVN